MTKHKMPDTLTETQLAETRGGSLIGFGTTVVSEVSTDAVTAAASGMSTNATAGTNGGTTLQEASPRTTEYIGGPPAIDKARHSTLLSTVRNLL